MTEAFGAIDLTNVTLDGEKLKTDVRSAIIGAEVSIDIDGAPTVGIELADPHRVLLKSGIFGSRVTTQIGPHSFELVAVRKNGAKVLVTFEHLVVAALRDHKEPRKVEPGTMTRAQFVRQLVAQEPWITFNAPVAGELIKKELSQGDVPDEGEAAKIRRAGGEAKEPENTWAASGRLAEEIGWRRFVRGPRELMFVPDSYLIGQAPVATVEEYKKGVDNIDFDYDIGQVAATGTITCRADTWSVPAGSTIEVVGAGPGDGIWLVSEISKSIFSRSASISIMRPRPTLPEPEASSTDDDMAGDELEGVLFPEEYEFDLGVDTSTQWRWPTDGGRITSKFGRRWNRWHNGIDIGVGSGTTVYTAHAGTVSMVAHDADGYGNWIEMSHGYGITTRYAHLSHRFATKRGMKLDHGEVVGLSGGGPNDDGRGNSQGAHLHYEIRVNGTPVDPERFMAQQAHVRTHLDPGSPLVGGTLNLNRSGRTQ